VEGLVGEAMAAVRPVMSGRWIRDFEWLDKSSKGFLGVTVVSRLACSMSRARPRASFENWLRLLLVGSGDAMRTVGRLGLKWEDRASESFGRGVDVESDDVGETRPERRTRLSSAVESTTIGSG